MHYVIPIFPYQRRYRTTAATVTSDVFELPPDVERISLHWLINTTVYGSGPTFDVRVQGAPVNTQANAWFTSAPCYRTGTAPNSIAGLMTFTQLATAGHEIRYSEYVPPYIRAIMTIGGGTLGSVTGNGTPVSALTGLMLVCRT